MSYKREIITDASLFLLTENHRVSLYICLFHDRRGAVTMQRCNVCAAIGLEERSLSLRVALEMTVELN